MMNDIKTIVTYILITLHCSLTYNCKIYILPVNKKNAYARRVLQFNFLTVKKNSSNNSKTIARKGLQCTVNILNLPLKMSVLVDMQSFSVPIYKNIRTEGTVHILCQQLPRPTVKTCWKFFNSLHSSGCRRLQHTDDRPPPPDNHEPRNIGRELSGSIFNSVQCT
jgi:hypothetical protein